MITKIDFKNSKLCDCCHTKIATKLCDYIVGYWNVAFKCGCSYNEFARQNRYETCDLNLCDDCGKRRLHHQRSSGRILSMQAGYFRRNV